jgi:hypothetical protein
LQREGHFIGELSRHVQVRQCAGHVAWTKDAHLGSKPVHRCARSAR